MEYLKICEVAKIWGLSERGVQALCAQGKIEGATRFGRSWMIPKNAKKPIDGRTKSGKAHVNEDMPLPRKTPFLYMSDPTTRPELPIALVRALPTTTRHRFCLKPRLPTPVATLTRYMRVPIIFLESTRDFMPFSPQVCFLHSVRFGKAILKCGAEQRYILPKRLPKPTSTVMLCSLPSAPWILCFIT